MANTVDELAILKGPTPIDVEGKCAQAVSDMERAGRRIQVIGRIVDGRVEIDQASLDKVAERFPNANMSFVAVNAPFDPHHTITLA